MRNVQLHKVPRGSLGQRECPRTSCNIRKGKEKTMRAIQRVIQGCLLLGVTISSAQAAIDFGRVLCDANLSGMIDSGDVPVQSVLVVVTNLSGTFSNANWTTSEGI